MASGKLTPRAVMMGAAFLCALLLAAAAFAQDAKQTVVAVVVRINGSLEFREKAGADWKQASKGQALLDGYQLRTGIGNKAMIQYASSGTRVLVNENTEIEIQAQTPGALQKPTLERTKLIVGEVYSNLSGRAEKTPYEVETPSSVASVRGTQFNSRYGNGSATYLVLENLVNVLNQYGSLMLEQYQQSTVPDGSAPGQPTTLTKNQAENQIQWTAGVDPLWKLNLVPEGGTDQQIGVPFKVTLWVQNNQTGSLDPNASFPLESFGASTAGVEFSVDNMQTWTQSPILSIVNGQASFHVRGVEEGATVLRAAATNCEPGELSMTIGKVRQKKTLELQFADPDGSNTKTLIIELEEK